MKLPGGYRASGVACGLKPSGALDLGLLVSDRPASAAGVFTTNRVQAAPVTLTRRHLRSGTARAIVANAGNANACTGRTGTDDARAMAKRAATALGLRERETLVASTGVIGVPMNMSKVGAGIGAASSDLSPDGIVEFARAIMTTDTRPKIAATEFDAGLLVGVAKGAGMLAPEMATMLSFIVTDAPLERAVLSESLREAVGATFNRISLDACRSTNDCVIVLANGAAGGETIGPSDPTAKAFAAALLDVCDALAREIAADGEGATKLVTVEVQGATNEREALRAARSVADSVLFRCALHGADPNWGRVLAALGASGISFDPNVVDVALGGEKLCERGAPGPGDAAAARAALSEREVTVAIDLNRGSSQASVLTNDLSPEYVRINAEYTT
jgi:glutamate N-acetyltransferase / amino-acid N-acetyltransferase